LGNSNNIILATATKILKISNPYLKYSFTQEFNRRTGRYGAACMPYLVFISCETYSFSIFFSIFFPVQIGGQFESY
jgi:hypothetical protein